MNEQDPYDDKWNRRVGVACFLVAFQILLFIIMRFSGCSVAPKSKEGPPPQAPVPPPTEAPEPQPKACGELGVGQVLESECSDGSSKVEICLEKGLQVVRDCPQDCEKVTSFTEVQPVLGRSCAGCHTGYDTLPVARSKIDAFIARVSLADENPQRMPKAPSAALSVAEKDLLKAWRTAGLLETSECTAQVPPAPAPGVFVTLDQVESVILDDITAIDPQDREDFRYLVSAHRLNAGAEPVEMATYEKSANKAVHAVSLERDVYPVQKIAEGVYRVDVEELGIDGEKWLQIEAADKVNLESFTSKGAVIKGLIGGGVRLPWLHVDNFSDLVMADAQLYYDLLEIPGTFQELLQREEVDFAKDLAEGEAALIGLPDSPLAPHNRLMSRHESEEGYFWTTFDTGALNVAEKNLFQFPLLADTGTATPFVFVASETIYTLPNGLQGYALFNAQGVRQDKAPVDVVRDFASPVSSEIQNSISCHRCHNAGLLPREDTILAHVKQNAAQFLRADVDRVTELYRTKQENAQIFAGDNAVFADALKRLGMAPTESDPISFASDKLRLAWDVKKMAAFLFLTETELKDCVNGSATGRIQAGQLLTGGAITFDQLKAVLVALKADCRLFQDPL